jgi:hypothetical protein
MMLARFRMCALAVTSGAAAVGVAVLGLAASAQAAAGADGGGGPAGAHARASSVINSAVFAGYQATVAAGSATSSAAQYKLPALSCTSATRGITPVAGVGVNAGGTSTFSSAFAFALCQNGKAAYYPALVINGSETNYASTALHAGNVIKVATKVTTAGTTVSVRDVSTGVTKKLTGPGASSGNAYIGDSDVTISGSLVGVPNFGTVTFTSCSVDGKALAAAHPARYQRVNGSTVQITTGALSSKGTAFVTHFKHS